MICDQSWRVGNPYLCFDGKLAGDRHPCKNSGFTEIHTEIPSIPRTKSWGGADEVCRKRHWSKWATVGLDRREKDFKPGLHSLGGWSLLSLQSSIRVPLLIRLPRWLPSPLVPMGLGSPTGGEMKQCPQSFPSAAVPGRGDPPPPSAQQRTALAASLVTVPATPKRAKGRKHSQARSPCPPSHHPVRRVSVGRPRSLLQGKARRG